MHTGGKEYRRLVGAFERVFGATIFFGTDTLAGKATWCNAAGSISCARPRSGGLRFSLIIVR